MALELTSVVDLGDDVLEVTAYDGEIEYKARGWVSALTNHYDDTSIGKDGHRKKGSTSRKMDKSELMDYAERLIREQNKVAGDESVNLLALDDDAFATAVTEAKAVRDGS